MQDQCDMVMQLTIISTFPSEHIRQCGKTSDRGNLHVGITDIVHPDNFTQAAGENDNC
jgi:hypothetical protein